MPLTDPELELVSDLGQCMSDYARLPHSVDLDITEFAFSIHVLQRAVMARAAQRDHPERFIRGRMLQ